MARGLGGTDRNPGDRPLVEARRKVSGVPRWSRTRVQPRILERAAAGVRRRAGQRACGPQVDKPVEMRRCDGWGRRELIDAGGPQRATVTPEDAFDDAVARSLDAPAYTALPP